MRTYKTEGIIIKRKNYGEADRILTVFTKYYGKIQVRAAGIRRIQSRRSAHVELLNYSILGLYKGRSIPILTEAQAIENFSSIKSSLQKIGDAYHLCEIIDGLCPENQENTKVFYMLKNILTSLSENLYQANSTITDIREFEIDLLTTLGYWNKADMLTEEFNTHSFIENILERKLKSRDIFSKLQ
jgi:DNA repair protein RecO (recombination protein O)